MRALSVDVEVALTECMALTDVDEFRTFKNFDAIILLFSASLKAVKHCYVWRIYAGHTYSVFAYEKLITCPLLLLDMF